MFYGQEMIYFHTIYECSKLSFTLNVGLQPIGLTREAWNVLKLISAYAAKKKLEMRGAMAFSSPA